MSTRRIKELQDFANDFYNKLLLSDELPSISNNKKIDISDKILKKAFSTLEPKNRDQINNYRKSLSKYDLSKNKYIFKPIKKIKLAQKKLNIYKTLEPWIPPKYEGDYFEKYKRLQDHYDMSNWEKVNYIKIIYLNNILFFQYRIHLCSRSYQKEKLLPLKKDFTCRKLNNYEINKFPNTKINLNEATKNMSKSGRKLIKVFINENNIREQKKRDEEEKLYKYKHSKPPLQLNSWKFSNHVIEEFSKPKADEIYGYREKIKTKYKYTVAPFRRPKEKGELFDKHIGIL